MRKAIYYTLHGFILFCNLLVIFLVSLAGNLWVNENAHTVVISIMGMFTWSLVLFYLGYLLFAPKFYLNRKYIAFLTSFLGASLLFPLLANIDKVFSAISGNGWMNYTISGYIQVVFVSSFICASGVLLRIIIDWINTERKKNELENEKIQSKLKVLVNQSNPHFVFNVLNNIDSLITTKPAKASETISILSNLLRYIYTNSEKDEVSLSSELEYIKNYIELQSLRFENNINFSLENKIDPEKIRIAPMIFLPFIENTFKHGVIDKNHPINITLSSNNGDLLFKCQNYFNPNKRNETKSGFGISNIIKRLDLIYPTCYELNVENQKEIYTVLLRLKINED